MNIAYPLEKFAKVSPLNTALIFENQKFSYAKLNQMSCAAAEILVRKYRIEKGMRVALYLPNGTEFVAFYYGILKLGAVAVSINSKLKSEELEHILKDSQCTVLIATLELLEFVPAVENLEVELATPYFYGDEIVEIPTQEMCENDPAAILYSSGTTGVPKGVVLTHGNILFNVESKRKYCEISSDDIALLHIPLAHCYGQNDILNSMINVGATVLLTQNFELRMILENIRDHNVTMLYSVPTVFTLMLRSFYLVKDFQEHFSSVRYCFSGAALMPPKTAQEWKTLLGQVIYEGYGLTESSPFACYNHADQYRQGSIGSPIDGVEMKIVDIETGQEKPVGQVGEILIKGPNVMLGYWNMVEETEQAIVDGWLKTGDVGKRDDENYFYIVDRIKDMINVGGQKVFSAEVENVLCRHSAISEAVVFAGHDEMMGERVQAMVVLMPETKLTVKEVVAFCRPLLADYKLPTIIDFVQEIPKCNAGKYLKKKFRELAMSVEDE